MGTGKGSLVAGGGFKLGVIILGGLGVIGIVLCNAARLGYPYIAILRRNFLCSLVSILFFVAN